MKNIKIGMKFALSFGGLLLLLAVVSLWSVFGIKGIVGNAEEVIDGNKLRGDMVQREVDHLNWASKVNALLVDEKITELDVQTDPHKCAFGKWLYGEERQQAEHAIPALKALLAEIEKPHSELHASAVEIEEVFKQADPKLPGMLAERTVDHLNWGAQIKDAFLENKQTLEVQTDPTQCRLGKWLASDKAKEDYANGDSDFKAVWDTMVEHHKELHESAKNIQSQYAQIHPGLEETLLQHLIDHKNWSEKLSSAVIDLDGSIGDVETNPNECRYGKFLESQELKEIVDSFPELGRILAESRIPHEEMHKSATDIQMKILEGNDSEAEHIYIYTTLPALTIVNDVFNKALAAEEEFHHAQEAAIKTYKEVTLPILHKTISSLDEMKKEAEHELHGMAEANRIFATQSKPNLNSVQKLLAELRQTVDGYMMTDEAMIAAAGKTNTAVIVISVIALAVGLVVAFFMSRSITVPLAATVAMISEMSKGHLTKRLKLNRGDEIGKMAEAMDNFSDDLEHETVGALEKLSAGDLTFEAIPKDSDDAIGNALKKTGDDLNNMIMEIQMASVQIATGSGQVSDASQSLSQGASESAASLEQITSSMTEMAAQTKTNAESSGQANQLAGQARDSAEKGNHHMNNLVKAIDEINESGQNISKIIKVIDEIAFQTNLLALNAAVEAARAGKHGKGFAVVAEEVRNLAARSAKAAQETAELIEGSVEKAKNGTEIADRTSEALAEIVAGATKVTDLVGEIAAASNEQAQGISQVNQGLSQIEQVTQQNTASAEECAAASEELSSQAMHLQNMMAKFKIKGHGAAQALPASQRVLPHHEQPKEEVPYPSSPVSPNPKDVVINLDDEEFGKY